MPSRSPIDCGFVPSRTPGTSGSSLKSPVRDQVDAGVGYCNPPGPPLLYRRFVPQGDARGVAGIGEVDRMSEFVKIAEVKDVPVGTGISIETQGKSIALFNCAGTFLAIDDTCPHQGGPLGEGELAGTVVTCPWHEWHFDVRTGVNTDDATCKVQSYPVKLDGADVLIQP